MAGEPLIEELALDIQPALDALTPLGDALTQLATDFATSISDALSSLTDLQAQAVDVQVTADTSGLDAGIADAFDAPRPPIDVEGDTANLVDSIDAVESASLVIPVAADTSEAEAQIASLDTIPVTVSADADTSEAQDAIGSLTDTVNNAIGGGGGGSSHGEGLSGLEGAIIGVKASTAGAKGEVGELAHEVGGLSAGLASGVVAGAAFTAFLGEVVSVSADAQAQEARFNATFGESAEAVKSIDVGGLTTDLETLAKQTGTTVADLENSATRIGLLGNAAGAAGPEIAKTASDFIGLSGAIAASNPRFGDTATVLDTISRALATGRTRSLIPYGISISQTAIQQKALNDNLDKTKDTLTGYDKLVAGLSLVLAQQGDTLGGKYATGIKSAGIQLRALKTELEETLVTVGGPLLAPITSGLTELTPIAQSLALALGGVGHVAVPIFQEFAVAISPIAPILRLIADGLNAIPTPVIQAAGAMLVLATGLKAFLVVEALASAGAALFGVELGVLSGTMLTTAASAGIMGTAIEIATGPVGLAIAAITVIAGVLGVFSSGQKEAKKDVEGLTGALFAEASTAQDLASAVGSIDTNLAKNLAETLTGKDAKNANENSQAIHALGISYGDLAKGVNSSDQEFNKFINKLSDQAKAAGLSDNVTNKFTDSLVVQRETLQASAGAQLDALFSEGKLTQAQFDRIRAQNGVNDQVAGSLNSTGDYVAALKQATEVAIANEKATLAQGLAAGTLQQAFLALKPSIADGTVTEKDAQAQADRLGISLEDATSVIKSLKSAMDSFVSTGLAALPAQSAALDTYATGLASARTKIATAANGTAADVRTAQAELVKALDPQTIIDAQNKTIFAIAAFQQNVDILIKRGRLDAAAQLIAEGPEKGADAAAAFVNDDTKAKAFDQGLQVGNKVRAGYAADLESHKAELSGISVTLADGTITTLANALSDDETVPTAAEGLAERTVTHFKPNLASGATAGMKAAAAALASDPSITQAAGEAGLEALHRFQSGIGPLPLTDAIDLAVSAAKDALGSDTTLPAAAETKGKETGDKLKPDFQKPVQDALDVASRIFSTFEALNTAAETAGTNIGVNFGTGLVNGMLLQEFTVKIAAARIGASAAQAISDALGIKSPSKVGIKIGSQFVQGFTLGIVDEGHQAVAATALLSQAVVDQLQAILNRSISLAHPITDAVSSFASSAVSSLPSIGSAISLFTSNAASANQKVADDVTASHKATTDLAKARVDAAAAFADAVHKNQVAASLQAKVDAEEASLKAGKAAAKAAPDTKSAQEILDLQTVQTATAATINSAKVKAAADRLAADAAGRSTVAAHDDSAAQEQLAKDRSAASQAQSEATQANTAAVSAVKALTQAEKDLSAAQREQTKDTKAAKIANDPATFTKSLNRATSESQHFLADIKKLKREGDTDLAQSLATAGPEAASKLADAFAKSPAKAKSAEAAIDHANAFAKSYQSQLEKLFGPAGGAATAAATAGKTLGQGLVTGLKVGLDGSSHAITDKLFDAFAPAAGPQLTLNPRPVQTLTKAIAPVAAGPLSISPLTLSGSQIAAGAAGPQNLALDLTIVLDDGQTVHATTTVPVAGGGPGAVSRRVQAEVHAS